MTIRKPKAFDLSDISTDTADTSPKDSGPSKATKRTNTTAPPRKRKPQAIAKPEKITLIDDDVANGLVKELDPDPMELKSPRGIGWFTIFATASLSLLGLGAGLAVESLIFDLFARHQWLGWFGAGLVFLIIIALTILIFREAASLFRLRSIGGLQEKFGKAHDTRNLALARSQTKELVNLYLNDPATAQARASVNDHYHEIIDADDLIRSVETELMAVLDHRARKLVMNAAKRVSLVTAISPRAMVDIAYVGFENLKLIRELSKLYGGRPGIWSFLRLSRNVVAHLAATGALSVGDGLIQQFVGHGLATKLSSRLGEGVINGLLTVRIGISAMDNCRPMPFKALSRPGVSDFASELVQFGGAKDANS